MALSVRRTTLSLFTLIALAVTPLLPGPAVAAETSRASGSPALTAAQPVSAAPTTAGPRTQDVCGATTIGKARCLAKVRTDAAAAPRQIRTAAGTLTTPSGYGPAELRAAYKLPAVGARSLVAVVIAFDVPNAEADLATYRSTFGLPACTSANGCFRKVNQNGDPGPYPAPDGGWALEGSLDLQMVSAGCPSCTILLVTAQTNNFVDLAAATRSATRLGATVVSHSYGGNEWGGMWSFASVYNQPGAISVASSGDYGFTAALAPAVLPGVLGVGGTSLFRAPNVRGWTEDVWSGAGSSCSAYVAKPAHQTDPNCQMRTVSDLSAVADPATGVAVYDSYPNPFGIPPGWLVLGGTSASAPLIAGMIGSKGNGSTYRPGQAYKKPWAFYDVIGGSNGFCGGDYLCTGLKGYDAPSGLGSPKGLNGL